MLDRTTCVACLWSQVATLVTGSICYGPPELTVGSKAPEIFLGEYVQAPDGAPTKLQELRGRVVVLDFSTTWCVGCVLAAPHINKLVNEFKDDPVVFLTISNETGPDIRRFLKNHKLDTWIALDDANQTTEAFAIAGYPQAIVIDKNGRVAALCHPVSITPAAIRKVMAGQPAGLDIKYNSGVRGNVDWAQGAAADPDSADSVSQVILRRSMARGGVSQFKPGSGRISGDGVGLESLIRLAYDVDRMHFEYRLPESAEIYRFSVRALNGSDEAARTLLRAALEASFDFTTSWREENKQVVVLTRTGGGDGVCLKPTVAETPGGGANSMGIQMTKQPFQQIVKLMGAFMYDVPMVDETGLSGEFDIDIGWGGGGEEAKGAALAECGLQITREQRLQRTLVVDPID